VRRRLAALDLRLLRCLRTRGHAPAVEAAVLAYSRLGEHGALWHGLALLGAVVDPHRRPLYLRAMRAILLTYGMNTAIKQLTRRARPTLDDLPHLMPSITGRSYPSAHASMSFAAARSLSDALPAPALYAAAAAMALSRPYLGVHYPSDIAAGALLGDALGLLTP
jgi:membrane-associated phospholipid phosphatase